MHIQSLLKPLAAGLAMLPLAASNPLHQLEKRAVQLVGGRITIGSDGGTYPRAAVLADGSVMATYAHAQSPTKYLEVVKSTNGGSTWGSPIRAVSAELATHDLDNPFIFQLSNGNLLLAYRNHVKNGNTYTSYSLDVSRSTDGGNTWSHLSTLVSSPTTTRGDWEPFLRYGADGRLEAYYSHTNSDADQDSIVKTSTDGGATWSAPRTIGGADVTARDGMIGVARTGSSANNLIMVFESQETGRFHIYSKTSSDGGATWDGATRKQVYGPASSSKNAGAPQVVNINGVLVCSFMTDEDSSGYTWPAGASTKVVTSTNGGSSWSAPTTIFPVEADWDGMVVIGSNVMVMAGFNGVPTGQKISVS